MKFLPWQMERMEEVVMLWNKELDDSFPMRFELFKQNSFLDENIYYEGSCLVVNKEDRVIGFIVVKYLQERIPVKMQENIGWIQAILVDSEFRNQGIGSNLLKHSEEMLKQKGLGKILLGRDMYHYFPGIPSEDKNTARWFEKRGYEHYTTEYDMIRAYNEGEAAEWPNKQKMEFSLLEEAEKEKLLDFLHCSFPGRWEYEAIHYFNKGGTGREFIVVKEEGAIIGFCRINDAKSPIIMGNVNWQPLFNEAIGGIGPLGVAVDRRKGGYGMAIVEAGVAFLRERGINRIIIDWTGLVDFYRKLGYEIWKNYKAYQKVIK